MGDNNENSMRNNLRGSFAILPSIFVPIIAILRWMFVLIFATAVESVGTESVGTLRNCCNTAL